MRQTAHEAHFAVLELEQAKTNLLITAKADTVAGKRFEVAYNRYVIGRISDRQSVSRPVGERPGAQRVRPGAAGLLGGLLQPPAGDALRLRDGPADH